MSAGNAPTATLPRAPARGRAGGEGRREAAPTARGLERADGLALLALGAAFLVLAALTWGTWGNPQTDFGVELTAADRIAHGATLYEDIRYFYGPLGVYAQALAFTVFGTGFTTAFALGLGLTLAILASFYALARSWLTPSFATAATAIVMAIGFTGTLFGYVAPFTTAATFGVLAILLELLALARGRVWLAGLAAGAVALTRPEFAVVGLAIGVGFVAGRAFDSGLRPALRDLGRLFTPALLIPLVVFAPFAQAVGVGDLLFEQLVPLDAARAGGLSFSADWAPFTATSGFAMLARGLVYAVVVAGLAIASVRWRERPGPGAFVPLLLGILGLLALDAAAHVLGAFPGTVGIVQTEAKRMLLGVSWLPLAAVAAAVWAAVRARQGLPAPISGTWAVDLALLAGALMLSARAYNRFTTDTYAAYYAPLLVLLAVILQERIANRFPGARAGVLVALGAVFAGLAWSAVHAGPVFEEQVEVRTARGTYLAPSQDTPAYQEMLDVVRSRSPEGSPVLALPLAGGLPFAADRPPALRELQFHPGVLDSPTDEREAIATLRERGVRLVVQGNARFDAWGSPVIGVDYDRLLLSWIHDNSKLIDEAGDFRYSPEGQIEPRAYRVYELSPAER
jgi:hypothetical protein